jgi:hypothetical protein
MSQGVEDSLSQGLFGISPQFIKGHFGKRKGEVVDASYPPWYDRYGFVRGKREQ